MILDADQLLTFLAVTEQGGISAAARTLHRGQPAISERLQKLTNQVGEPLYIRDGRGIRLTAAGQALIPSAQRVRAALEEAGQIAMARQRLQQGHLRVAATNTLANYFLPRRLADFQERHPDIRIHLKGGITDWEGIAVTDWDIFFLEGTFDIAQLPPYYEVRPWIQDEIVCVAPPDHPLHIRGAIDWNDLLRFPIIWREPTSGIRKAVEAVFAERRLTPQFILEVIGIEAVVMAVAAGLGIGFVTRTALAQCSEWTIRPLSLPTPAPLFWTLYCAAPRPPYQSQAVKGFLTHLGSTSNFSRIKDKP